jgi:hypothetical protein
MSLFSFKKNNYIVIFGASSTNIFSKVPQILGLTRNVIIRDLWIVVNNVQKVESASVSEEYFPSLKHRGLSALSCFSKKQMSFIVFILKYL